MSKRTRMIFELPREVQMAIKLRAVKTSKTTGEVVEEAIRRCFPEEFESAIQAAAEPRMGGGDVQ